MATFDRPGRFNAAEPFIDCHAAHGRGVHTAIICGDRRITYDDLRTRVNRVGNALSALGVRMEERVAILQPDSPEWVYSFFGAIKIGAVAVPLNTMLQPREYEYLLDDSRARILVVDSSLLDRIAAIEDRLEFLEHVVVTGPGASGRAHLDDLMNKASPELTAAATSRDDAAFWLYSSGTTGFPKGAIHHQYDMVVAADRYAGETLGLTAADTSFSVAKLFFAYGLGNGLYFPLRFGGTTVLLPDRPAAETVFAVIDRDRPTVFYSVPTSYAALLQYAQESGRTSLGRVRMCVSAGEPLPRSIFQRWKDRFGVEILDGIGSTEILHIFISNRPGRVRPGSTGEIVPGYEARIVGDDGNDLPRGETGNLLIRGDSIASGYWNKRDLSRDTFQGHWIDTHDKFRLDEDGYFWFAGRGDDLIKVGGQFVWPAEVESVLLEHPAVLECGVIGVEDEDRLTKPRAYVVLKDRYPPSAELSRELQEFVKANAAHHKYPRSVVFIDALPKTATGKIQRFRLREMAEEPLQ